MTSHSASLLAASLIVCLSTSSANAQGKKGGAASTTASSSSSTATTASGSSPSTAAFESQMLAFGAVDRIAAALAKKVTATATDKAPIVIYDQTAFATLQSYEAFIANLNVLVGAYQTLITTDIKKVLTDLGKRAHERELVEREKAKSIRPKGKERETAPNLGDLLGDSLRRREEYMSLAATGPAFGDPFSDATALLTAIAISSNTETPGAITIPDSVMAVAVTRDLTKLNPSMTIIYPPLFGQGSSTDFASADIQANIQVLDDFREWAHKDVDRANEKFINDHPAKAAVAGVGGAAGTPATPGVSGDAVLTAALADIDGLYDSFMNSLLQVNSSTGVIGSAAVIQGYQLAMLLGGQDKVERQPKTDEHEAIPEKAAVPKAYVLLASFVAAGGTERVHKTFWTALTTGDKITYSGGAVVNVSLWRSGSTSPLYADVLRYRAPFTKMNPKPGSGVDGVAIGDNLSK